MTKSMNEIQKISTYLSFIIDNEYFAVNVGKVLEVLLSQKITRIPNVSNEIKGVINFRGEIIPLFETRSLFGVPNRNENEKLVVIVLEIASEAGTAVIGAMADKVKDVITIEPAAVLPVPKMHSRINTDYISGIYQLNDKFIMLLDVDKMFNDSEIEDFGKKHLANI
ncbi:MAG TPA: hypothetical protein DCQ31_06025 [Bacteroidales bacterium]|nr:hypothetical protein [Bacteroidales bacterium]